MDWGLFGKLIMKLEEYIDIISSRDLGDLSKTETIKNYLIDNIEFNDNKNNIIPVIYCIGDGDPEYNGSEQACKELWDDNFNNMYLLNRIKLLSNRKYINKQFKSLKKFENTLKNTQSIICESNKKLLSKLKFKLYSVGDEIVLEKQGGIISLSSASYSFDYRL